MNRIQLFLNEPFSRVRSLVKTIAYFAPGDKLEEKEAKYLKLLIKNKERDLESKHSLESESVVRKDQCERITLEGNQHGVLVVTEKNRILFDTVANAPHKREAIIQAHEII